MLGDRGFDPFEARVCLSWAIQHKAQGCGDYVQPRVEDFPDD